MNYFTLLNYLFLVVCAGCAPIPLLVVRWSCVPRCRVYLAPILAPLSASPLLISAHNRRYHWQTNKLYFVKRFLMSHNMSYVNYSDFLRYFREFFDVSRGLLNYGSPEISLPHHPVVPAWDSLGSPRHRIHQKKLPMTPTLNLKGWSPRKIYTIFPWIVCTV